MNPIIAAGLLELFKLGTSLWRQHANKPPEWQPTEADWAELQAMAAKSAADYKAEAAAKAL